MERNGWRGYYLTAYGIAVKHGFSGTEEEWLRSLIGYTPKRGVDYYTEEDKAEFLKEIGEMAVLPHTHTSTDVFGADTVVTYGSKNLITSGAVDDAICNAFNQRVVGAMTENNSGDIPTVGAAMKFTQRVCEEAVDRIRDHNTACLALGSYEGTGTPGINFEVDCYPEILFIEGNGKTYLVLPRENRGYGLFEGASEPFSATVLAEGSELSVTLEGTTIPNDSEKMYRFYGFGNLKNVAV